MTARHGHPIGRGEIGRECHGEREPRPSPAADPLDLLRRAAGLAGIADGRAARAGAAQRTMASLDNDEAALRDAQKAVHRAIEATSAARLHLGALLVELDTPPETFPAYATRIGRRWRARLEALVAWPGAVR